VLLGLQVAKLCAKYALKENVMVKSRKRAKGKKEQRKEKKG